MNLQNLLVVGLALILSVTKMKHNAILFSKVDREDYWVTGGLVFKVNNTDTYEDAYHEVKDKLETPETIKYIIKDRSIDALFDGDETYDFKRTHWKNYQLYFEFENSKGEIVEYILSADFVKLIQ